MNSFSTSPEPTIRPARRSNSSLSTAFASFSRPFSITASSSPPVHERLRNESDLSTSAPTSGITWGTNTFYIDSGPSSPVTRRKSNTRSSSFAIHETAFDSSEDEFDLLDDDDIGVVIGPDTQATTQSVKITLKNQHMFDEESYASVSLLDP